MGNTVLFFGAGAEYSFGLPTGPKFTKNSLLTKNEKLYDALEHFYATRTALQDDISFAGKYHKIFMFQSNGYTYRKLIKKTVSSFTLSEQASNLCKRLFALAREAAEKEESGIEDEAVCKAFYEEARLAFADLVAVQPSDTYKELLDHLTYYGIIEKDFSTINQPSKVGVDRFWRLLNYFWSAFFCIVSPVLKACGYDDYENYDEILSHLNEVLRFLDSNAFLKKMQTYAPQSYYQQINTAIQNAKEQYSIITTNYTRLCELTGIHQVAYLAGRINQFEYPHLLEVKDIDSVHQIEEHDFVFPYLLTQAHIKPIICERQLREYQHALQQLDACDHIIMIGYSLCEEDNHIVSLLRSYIKDRHVTLSYMNYGAGQQLHKENLLKRLRLTDIDVSIQVYNYTESNFYETFYHICQSQQKTLAVG